MERELLYRFFSGKASVEEVRKVKEWSDASPENYRLLLKERRLFDAMQVFLPSDGDAVEKSKYKVKPLRYAGLVREVIKIAAVILVAVGATVAFLAKGDKNFMAMQTITVPPGQRVNLTLPDGTDVWLNAGTKMSYPLSFLSEKREVTLDGEAFFDVAHDEDCPFVVHTFAKDIEVLGTQFDVEAYQSKATFQTSLIQGKVKVSSVQDDDALILTPGYRAAMKHGKLQVEKIDYYDVYRWKEGLYCFRNKSFVNIMNDLEKYYDISIDVQNDKLDSVMLTGKFRISEGLDYLLRVLQSDVNFSYHRDIEENIIYIQ